MGHAYLVVRRSTLGDEQVLLTQRNLFLPPNDYYDHAAVAHHATQYILPGGKVAPGESPLAAAIREFYEDTDVQLPPASVRPLIAATERSFFEVVAPSGLELGRINASLSRGGARSAKSNNMTWVSIDSAAGWFGMKTEYQHLPWVTEQVQRAIQAGFGREHIAPRVNDPHESFITAMNSLRGTGSTIALKKVDY
jgi:hypothetical protein